MKVADESIPLQPYGLSIIQGVVRLPCSISLLLDANPHGINSPGLSVSRPIALLKLSLNPEGNISLVLSTLSFKVGKSLTLRSARRRSAPEALELLQLARSLPYLGSHQAEASESLIPSSRRKLRTIRGNGGFVYMSRVL